jgi:acyl dehydratase
MTAYDRLTVGSRVTTPGRTISDGAASTIVAMAGYTHPMFTDPTYIARSTSFTGRPIPGELSLLFLGGMAEQTGLFDETTLALVALDAVEFKTPALVGDTIHLEIEVSDKRRSPSGRRGFITFAWTCRNQRDEIVLTARATLAFRTAEG